jgi:hypothetical protein
MPEIALVLLALLAIGLLGLATTLVTPQLMTAVGLWTLLLGLVAGIPTGLWHHVVLYRVLSKKSCCRPDGGGLPSTCIRTSRMRNWPRSNPGSSSEASVFSCPWPPWRDSC